MNLRGFHYVFIILSVILSFGFAGLEFSAYSKGQLLSDAIVGGIAALIGIVLAAYGVWFFRKSRRLA